jgi:phosphate transport system substrate-binding protein
MWKRKSAMIAPRFLLVGILVTASVLASAPFPLEVAHADTLILQGSTPFARRLMQRYEELVEEQSGHQLTIIPNKSLPGLIGLIEGRAHMAMISAPLSDEKGALEKVFPDFNFDRLQVHPIAKVPIAITVHGSNKVRRITREQVKKVLNGEINNWLQLGGADLVVKPILVGGGGGVTSVVEGEVLAGQHGTSKNILYLKTPVQLVQVVEQEAGAMGFAQYELAHQHAMHQLKIDPPIEQSLSLITLGDPTPAMKAVIESMRRLPALPTD